MSDSENSNQEKAVHELFAEISERFGQDSAKIWLLLPESFSDYLKCRSTIPEKLRPAVLNAFQESIDLIVNHTVDAPDDSLWEFGLNHLDLTDEYWNEISTLEPIEQDLLKQDFIDKLNSHLRATNRNERRMELAFLSEFFASTARCGFKHTLLTCILIYRLQLDCPWSRMREHLNGPEWIQEEFNLLSALITDPSQLTSVLKQGRASSEPRDHFFEGLYFNTILRAIAFSLSEYNNGYTLLDQLLESDNELVRNTVTPLLCLHRRGRQDIVQRNISLDLIDHEENIEIRRALMRAYGESKYLTDSGTKVYHQDEFGTLYRKEIPDDEPICLVKVQNKTAEADGSFKEYFLRVPPTVQTAKEAVAWTFRMKQSVYAPIQES